MLWIKNEREKEKEIELILFIILSTASNDCGSKLLVSEWRSIRFHIFRSFFLFYIPNSLLIPRFRGLLFLSASNNSRLNVRADVSDGEKVRLQQLMRMIRT